MNCKQGDLAIFVKSNAGNEGKIVICVRLATEQEITSQGGPLSCGAVWVIDRPVKTIYGNQSKLAWDFQILPIRDPGDEATDETLQWLDVPTKETA